MLNPRLYRLPFDTGLHPIRITQGYNGPFSHFEKSRFEDLRYCLDFGLPEGATVLAARSGRVNIIFNDQTDCYRGTNSAEIPRGAMGNLLEIEHDDGTIGHYQHLMRDSMFGMFEGARIAQGQPIARTGLSGWIGPDPHLHFMVYRYEQLVNPQGLRLQTIPVFSEEELRAV